MAQVYPTVAYSIRCNIYPKRGRIAESGALLHAPATSGYLRASHPASANGECIFTNFHEGDPKGLGAMKDLNGVIHLYDYSLRTA